MIQLEKSLENFSFNGSLEENYFSELNLVWTEQVSSATNHASWGCGIKNNPKIQQISTPKFQSADCWNIQITIAKEHCLNNSGNVRGKC